MKTEIKIIADLNDEQLDVLIQEIKSTSEMMDIKLEVQSNELSQHDVKGSLTNRGCCMSCVHWRFTQNGMGECNKLKQYTDEGFDCKSWMEKRQ